MALRGAMTRLEVAGAADLVDTCGTGGGAVGTFNTFVLIASSVTVVMAWASLKLGRLANFKKFMAATIICALGFLFVKSFEYHAKFRDQQSVPWVGRVMVTCNDDVESIRILPDMEMNTLDKISLFKIKTVKDRQFPPRLHATIKEIGRAHV